MEKTLQVLNLLERDGVLRRVRLLREEATLDKDYLTGVLARHGLGARWKQWTP